MNFYPHHIGDFNNATRHLTRIERSIYRDMLDMYYDTEQPLPLDLKLLCRKLLARSEEEATAVEQMLNEFFTETEQGWQQRRCDEEIADYRANITAKQAAGKASAAKREEERIKRLTESNRDSTAVEQVLESVGSSVQLTRTKNQNQNQEPSKPTATTIPVDQPTRPENGDGPALGGAVALSIAFRAEGVKTQPHNPLLLALVSQGVSEEVVKAACSEAHQSKPGESIGLGYVVKIIERWARESRTIDVVGVQLPNARASPGIGSKKFDPVAFVNQNAPVRTAS